MAHRSPANAARKELQHARHGPTVEPQSVRRAGLEVPEMTLARLAYRASRQDLAREHAVRVRGDRIGPAGVVPHAGPFPPRKPSRSSSGSPVSGTALTRLRIAGVKPS